MINSERELAFRCIKSVQEVEKSQSVSVKIPRDEAEKLVVRELIKLYNGNNAEPKEDVGIVLRIYLDENEFEKYVINKKELE